METALYFPYIRVPQTPWFTQVLLYWDQAASIVPESLWREENGRYPYMHELYNAGLLQVLSPDAGLSRINLDDFEQEFLTFIGSPPPEGSAWMFTRVHTAKMSYFLFDQLQRLGLAKRVPGPERETWWQVEVKTADLYMAYLAGVMSAASPGMVPVTDGKASIGTIAGTVDDLNQKLAAMRYRVIMEALPAPQGPVPVAELKDFKERNAEPLLRCRRFLDDKLADLATIPDSDRTGTHFNHIMQEIEDDVAKLQEQMNKKKWPGVALVGFGGVTGSALATASALAAGGSPLALGLAVGSGILQMGAAGHVAIELMKKPRFNQRGPLVYAALAGQLG